MTVQSELSLPEAKVVARNAQTGWRQGEDRSSDTQHAMDTTTMKKQGMLIQQANVTIVMWMLWTVDSMGPRAP